MAKEFNIPLDEVLRWPLSKTLEYVYFLKTWYKIRFGDPEEMEDLGIDDFGDGMPKLPRQIKKNLPRGAKNIGNLRKFSGKSSRSLHGAGSHVYKFK